MENLKLQRLTFNNGVIADIEAVRLTHEFMKENYNISDIDSIFMSHGIHYLHILNFEYKNNTYRLCNFQWLLQFKKFIVIDINNKEYSYEMSYFNLIDALKELDAKVVVLYNNDHCCYIEGKDSINILLSDKYMIHEFPYNAIKDENYNI